MMIKKIKSWMLVLSILILPGQTLLHADSGNTNVETRDKIKQLQKLVDSLKDDVEELQQENVKVKAHALSVESSVEKITSKKDSVEISKALDSRIASLEDKVGTIKVSGAVTAIALSSINRKSNEGVQANDIRDPDASTLFNRFGQTGDNQTIGAGAFDLYLETKILPNTRIFANLEANSANQPIAPTIYTPNGNAGFSTHLSDQNIDVLNVLELYVESQFYDQRLTATVGKIDLSNYFDGNKIAWDEHRQFLSGIFVDNPTFISVMPANTIGVRGQLDIGWGLTAQIAAVSDDNSGQKLFNQMFAIAEIDYQTFLFFGKEGNYRAFSYLRDVPDTFDARGVSTGQGAIPMGVGFSIDQKLTNKLTAFSRFGWNESQLADSLLAVSSSISVGGQYLGLLPNRPDDVLGGAFGFSDPVNGVGASPTRDFREYVMEFYYNYKLASNVGISPVVQFVLHPNGDDDENWTAVLGGRAFLEF